MTPAEYRLALPRAKSVPRRSPRPRRGPAKPDTTIAAKIADRIRADRIRSRNPQSDDGTLYTKIVRRAPGRSRAGAAAPLAGSLEPDRARHRLDHRHRHLRADRHRRVAERRPGARAVDDHLGGRLRVRGAVLRRVRGDGAGGGQRVHLRLRDGRRALRLDHRLGPDPRVRAQRRRRSRSAGPGYFVSLARDLGITIPAALAAPPGAGPVSSICRPPSSSCVVSALLVIGIKQSADTNTLLVGIKALVLVVFVVAGAAYVNRDNLTPFIPPNTGAFGQLRVERRPARRGRDVLRLYRLRRGVDGGAGGEEPVARHADRHPGLAGHLHGASTSPWRSCCSASCRTSS